MKRTRCQICKGLHNHKELCPKWRQRDVPKLNECSLDIEKEEVKENETK